MQPSGKVVITLMTDEKPSEPQDEPDDDLDAPLEQKSVNEILRNLKVPFSMPKMDLGIRSNSAIFDAIAGPATLNYGQIESYDIPVDDSKWRTADAAEATAEAAARTAEYTAGLLEAMRRSVELNEHTRVENTRARRWSIGIGLASVAVAMASLAAAVVAINLSATDPSTIAPETVVTDSPSPERQ